jgi:predicted nucleic acid-binding protein
MSIIVFDTGPVISLTTNNLLWMLRALNSRYDGKFIVPLKVKKELIDIPLMTKRYKFEALQVMKEIREGTLHVYTDKNVEKKTLELLNLANNCFKGRGNWIKIVQYGEMEALAIALLLKADALVVDERNTRKLVEDPLKIVKLMRQKIGTKITIHKENLKKLKRAVNGVKILRSVELVMRAYELGMLDNYMPNKTKVVKDPKKTLLNSLLWGLKIRGCAISHKELDRIVDLELDA